MRALLALVAALALAACQVDLEGAACAVPGSSDQCPSGQRCGVDQRCSSSPVMTCPAPTGNELVVDAEAPAGAPEPTGARSPPACRFRRLEEALVAAAKVPGGAKVRATADTYSVTTTLAIPAGVTLQADEEPPSPADHVLSLEGGVSVGVSLAEGATLSGFTVRNVSAAPSAVGVDVACADTKVAQLSDVIVEEAAGASSSLANGVRAGGACPVVLDRITVRGASAAGLLVARDAAASTLVATYANLAGNGEGVRITRGDVTLHHPEVTASVGAGVIVWPAADRDVLLTIDQGGAIRANGDTGIVVDGKQAGRIRLATTRVCANGAVVARGGLYAQRKVGGLYLFGNPPPELALEGNFFFGNAGDQLLVAGVDTWALDGAPSTATACGAGVNLFHAYAPADGTTYVGLFAANAAVTARWNAWRLDALPLAGKDYAASGTSGSVTVGTVDQYCMVPAPTCD